MSLKRFCLDLTFSITTSIAGARGGKSEKAIISDNKAFNDVMKRTVTNIKEKGLIKSVFSKGGTLKRILPKKESDKIFNARNSLKKRFWSGGKRTTFGIIDSSINQSINKYTFNKRSKR